MPKLKIRAIPREGFRGYYLAEGVFVPSDEWVEIEADERIVSALEVDHHVRVHPRPVPCAKCAAREQQGKR